MAEKQQVTKLRDDLEAGDRGGSDADRDALLAFSDRMLRLREKYTWHRHLKLLRHCIRISENVDVDLVDARVDDEARDAVVDWIHRTYDIAETPYTNQDYRVALRMFGKRTLGQALAKDKGEPDDIVPPVLARVKTTLPRNFKPRPDPAKMLWWDDHIDPMLAKARHERDKAMIAVSWDLGARSGEMRSLRVGDITDHKYGLQVTVDGKTGQRSPTLIPSVPYLKRWLNVHPAPDDPTAPLWCDLDTARDVSYNMKAKMMKKPARKAGVDHTDITWRRMRKSSASYLASQNVSQAHLEDHHGWERGSNVAAHYVAVFSDANDRAVARAHGLEVEEDEPDPTAPLVCPRCQQQTPRKDPECVWCGQALSHEAVMTAKTQTGEILDALAGESGNPATALAQLGQLLDEYPALRGVIDFGELGG